MQDHSSRQLLFVPLTYSSLGSAEAIIARIERVEFLGRVEAQQLIVEVRLWPLVEPRAPETILKGSVVLRKEGGSSSGGPVWVSDVDGGSDVSFPLSGALLSKAPKGLACQLKFFAKGGGGLLRRSRQLLSIHVVEVPMEHGRVSLLAAKNKGKNVGTATFSVGRQISAEAQVVIARSIAQQTFMKLRAPAANEDLAACLDLVRPSRGWCPNARLNEALSISDGQRRNSMRLAADALRWDFVQSLAVAGCETHVLAEDLRSPLTITLEKCDQREVIAALLQADESLSEQQRQLSIDLWALLRDGAQGTRKWEALAPKLAEAFNPSQRPQCDIFVLALERCPMVRARKVFLCHPGAAAAIWKSSLDLNHPNLARKFAVWIGLSMEGFDGPYSRRQLLDVSLDGHRGGKSMLARVLEKAATDDRWIRVAKVIVHLGAHTNAYLEANRSTLLFTLEYAEQGKPGFPELINSLLEHLGTDIDQWTMPTVLLEERTADCPICFESLWTSTPTAFVSFADGGAGGELEAEPRSICTHFFCFDCAGQQVMKQQREGGEQMRCPICRNPARDVMPLPDLTVHPRLWFHFLDQEGNGRLDRNTLVQALEAVLPLDTEKLREALSDYLWETWDQRRDGQITEADFFAPGGLLEWVRGHQHELQTIKERGVAPTLDELPERWFKYWDWKHLGRLRRAELLRALCICSLTSSLETKRVQKLKAEIDAFWNQHCQGQGSISLEAFVKNDFIVPLKRIVAEVRSDTGAARSSCS
eukprot:gnl/MRDRNA2_/MRDRNA2_61986_c0_seq1.p1 gnl/MRDRNA2_/MRDRNA2_61986_c0~~gnl/MRDRNA2_/MRDRNA2_61986_c0_seq1.p1  ORF type:complete len:760 (-),score=139.88 gnl/MRDRNA2_/MRDRNA2_61986_c0_seq1:55-2334(-)